MDRGCRTPRSPRKGLAGGLAQFKTGKNQKVGLDGLNGTLIITKNREIHGGLIEALGQLLLELACSLGPCG